MAVELPEPLQWVLLLLAGTRWPEADEGQLRDMADHWRKAAAQLQDASHAADAAIKQALEGQQGVAADALAKHWADYSVGKGTEQDPGYLPGTIAACNGMGDMLEGMANSAETAKIQIIAQLGILAFELATAEAEAVPTLGASMAEIPVFVGITREVVQQFLKTLLKEALEHAVKQAVQMAAINLLAQTIELAQGHRKSIDMKELGQNALGGAVAGATGHLLGKGVGAAGAKMGLEGAMGSTVGKMATGAAVGVGTDAATQLITTGHVDGSSLLGSGLSGAGGAGLHAGAAAAKAHFNEAPKLPPEGALGGAEGEHGAPVTFKSGTDSGAGTATDSYRGPGVSAGDGEGGGTSGLGGSNGLSAFGSGRPAGSERPSAQESSLSDGRTPSAHDTTPAPDPALTREEPPLRDSSEALQPTAEATPAAREVPLTETTSAQEVPLHQSEPQAPVGEEIPAHEAAPVAEATPVQQEQHVQQEQSGAAPVRDVGAPDLQQAGRPVSFADPGGSASVSHASPELGSEAGHLGGAAPLPDVHTSGLDNTHLDGVRIAGSPAPVRTMSADRTGPSPDDAATPAVADNPAGTAPLNQASPLGGGFAPPPMGASAGGHSTSASRPTESSTPSPPPPASAPVRTGRVGSSGAPGAGLGARPSRGTGVGGNKRTREDEAGLQLGRVQPSRPAGELRTPTGKRSHDDAFGSESERPATPLRERPISTPRKLRDSDASSGPVHDTVASGGKRPRADDPAATGAPAPKRQRTPAYENTEAVLRDRGLEPPTREQHQALVDHLHESENAGERFPRPSEELLKLVNPHETSLDGGNLHSCLENTEALRDTHYGRPRPAAWPQEARAEDGAAMTLLKRHGMPREFGSDQRGIDSLLDQVKKAGPGTFSTVLFGRGGEEGHALALIHGPDGTLRWSDPSIHRTWEAEPGAAPGRFAEGRQVWAATSGPHEQDVDGGTADHTLLEPGAARFGSPTSDGKKPATGSSSSENHDDPTTSGIELADLHPAEPTAAESTLAPRPETETETEPAPRPEPVPDTVIPEIRVTPPSELSGPHPSLRPTDSSLRSSDDGAGLGGPTDHPGTPRRDDPAFAPTTPIDPARVLTAPSRVTAFETLGGGDLLVSLHEGDSVVLDRITGLFQDTFGLDAPAARTMAEGFFSASTLRPELSSLSRGNVVEAPFSGNGWEGKVAVTASVKRLDHINTADAMEQEHGSEQQSAIGSFDGTRWRSTTGLQLGTKGAVGSYTVPAEHLHDLNTDRVRIDADRVISRAKTVAPVGLFAGTLELKVDFSQLKKNGRPFETPTGAHEESLDIGATVGIPARDCLDADGLPQPVADHFQLPERVAQGQGLGAAVVLDVWSGRNPDSGRNGMTEVVSGIDGPGQEFFGGLWKDTKAKLLAEVDVTRLHQELRGMMAGQKIHLEVTDGTGLVKGAVEISADLDSAWQKGVTPPKTEFNFGTGVARSSSKQVTSSDAVTLPLTGQGALAAAKPGLLAGSSSAQFARDRVGITGNGYEVTSTTKTKEPGVVFDGVAALKFEFTKSTPLGTTHGEADSRIGFSALIPQADARRVEAPTTEGGTRSSDPTLFEADRTKAPTPAAPKQFPVGADVLRPPADVWRGGLKDTTTIRDLRDIRPLHAELNAHGERLLGKSEWEGVKQDVLQAFSHPKVSSRLVSMTRDLRLEAPEQTVGLLRHKVKVSATAHVTEMAYNRTVKDAERNPVSEVTTFEADRYLLSDAKTFQGQAGGGGQFDATHGLSGQASVSRQVRERDGLRAGTSGKTYSNGKYSEAQGLYESKVGVDVTVSVDGRDHTFTVELPAELSLNARDCLPGEVGEDGHAVFRPGDAEPTEAAPAQHLPPAEEYGAPPRLAKGQLSASDVVDSLGRGDTEVLRTIEGTLTRHAGAIPDKALMDLREAFDPFALKPRLSGLTRGGELVEEVSVNGWRGRIKVTAVLEDDFKHTNTVKAYEFQQGVQSRTASGVAGDTQTTTTVGASATANLPHAQVRANYAHSSVHTQGHTVDRRAGTVNTGKSVEPAGEFAGTTKFKVEFDLHKLGSSFPERHAEVPVETTVAVPLRHALPPTVHEGEVLPQEGSHVPARVETTHRLGDTDIVHNVFHLEPGRDGLSAKELTVRQLNAPGRNVLGSDWGGMKKKVLAALEPDRLQPQLKSMMAGQETVIKHGRSTVRIWASVGELEHVGDSAQVEFNAGTNMQHSFASSDGATAFGRGKGDTVTVTALGTSNPLPHGLAVVGGGGVTHGRGTDEQDVQARTTTSGMTGKSKQGGSDFTGKAVLHYYMERAPLLPVGGQHKVAPAEEPIRGSRWNPTSWPGAAKRGIRQLTSPTRGVGKTEIGFDALVETGATARSDSPWPFTADTADRTPRRFDLAPGEEQPVPVRVPPARIWDGPRDIDVMRWAGDVHGVQDVLRLRGPEYFGARNWKRMESAARNTLSHSQLSARFPEEITTPGADRRRLVSNGGVKASMELVKLEYRATDKKLELSPINESSTSTARTDLDWKLWGGQAQLGVTGSLPGLGEASVTASAGVQRRTRQGDSAADGGRAMSHAKFNTPVSVFDGYAKVTLTFFDGKREPLVEHGLIPVSIEIPDTECAPATVMSDHYLAFDPAHQTGEAISLRPPEPAPEATAPEASTPEASAPAEVGPEPVTPTGVLPLTPASVPAIAPQPVVPPVPVTLAQLTDPLAALKEPEPTVEFQGLAASIETHLPRSGRSDHRD